MGEEVAMSLVTMSRSVLVAVLVVSAASAPVSDGPVTELAQTTPVENTCTQMAATDYAGCTIQNPTETKVSLLGNIGVQEGYKSCDITCPTDGGAFEVTVLLDTVLSVSNHADFMYGMKDCSAATTSCNEMECRNENCECVDCKGYPGLTCESAEHKKTCEERDMCQWRSQTEDEGKHCVWAAPITLTWDEHSPGYSSSVAQVDVEIFDCSEYMGDIKTCPLFDVTELYLELDVDTLELTELADDGSEGKKLFDEPKSATYDAAFGYDQATFDSAMANNPFENSHKGWGFTGQSSTSKLKAKFTTNTWVAGEGFKLVVKCFPCGWFDAMYNAGQPYTTLADPTLYCSAATPGRTPATFNLRNDYPQAVNLANLKGYGLDDINMATPATTTDADALNWQDYMRNKRVQFGATFQSAYSALPPQETIPCP